MEGEAYVEQVLRLLPSELGGREEIAMEIRSTIAERLESGENLAQALEQLGPPLELAESYLRDHIMERVSSGRRVVAKLIDLLLSWVLILLVVIMVGAMFAVFGHAAKSTPGIVQVDNGTAEPGVLIVMLILLGMAVVFMLYPALCEWQFERTIGKHVMGIRVARESGARISFGQALLRNLPWVVGVGLFDCIFALFTKQHQRAVELLSHTRTILKGAE